MSVILVFLAAVALAAGWWLARQQLTARPWLETGVATAAPVPSGAARGRTGLVIFVTVIGGLFAMLGSAFVMQIEETPWELVPLPPRVWLNTALLVLASLFLQFAAAAARRGAGQRLRGSLVAASIATLAFLTGQAQLWRALTAEGYPLDGSPAASFFYLITGLHGLHILGGLAALGVICLRSGAPQAMAPATALCAGYWHALLAVWVVLFALLQGWGNAVLALCRAAVT